MRLGSLRPIALSRRVNWGHGPSRPVCRLKVIICHPSPTPCSVIVYANSSGGSFVIGDGNAAVGQKVTFWGAQWSKLNTLSGGSAPASFKGFENMPATLPPCGGTWSTDPGNSSNPPSSIPSYMGVIVSSSVTKKGSAISGNVRKLVVVKTNPGYGPNPGHDGTGTVVAVICQ